MKTPSLNILDTAMTYVVTKFDTLVILDFLEHYNKEIYSQDTWSGKMLYGRNITFKYTCNNAAKLILT